jgi:phenylalanyl-tRNA synthetase beta chain
MDLWDLKYHFELAVGVAFPGARLRPAADGTGWEAATAAGDVVGWGGTIDVAVPKWAAPLHGFEVRLVVAAAPVVAYRPLPVTPPVMVDVALVLPAGVSVAAVEVVLRREAGPLLEQLQVLSDYRGAGVPSGSRSVAWHCEFRDPVRTLRDKDVEQIVAQALRALEGELDVRRRERAS